MITGLKEARLQNLVPTHSTSLRAGSGTSYRGRIERVNNHIFAKLVANKLNMVDDADIRGRNFPLPEEISELVDGFGEVSRGHSTKSNEQGMLNPSP